MFKNSGDIFLAETKQQASTATVVVELPIVMSSRINGSQQPTRDLFGSVFQPNADIFTNDNNSNNNLKNSRFHQLKTDLGDRSSDDISVNSPNRRTPVHRVSDASSFDAANLSLATINQKTNALNDNNGTPLWFNNPKRRTVPSQVVKRVSENDSEPSSFLTKAKSSSSTSSSGFNTLTFGTRRNNNSEIGHVHALSDELPPTKTISDLQKEDNSNDSYLSFHHDHTIHSNLESSKNTPLNQKILSDSLFRTSQQSAFSTPSKSDGSSLHPFQSQQQPVEQREPHQLSSESAVLVFGYPESIANNVIKHFAKFGTILEDFESTRVNPIFHTKNQKKIYPIYTGNGWVKLTYDNKASAIRALEESGSVFFGSIIGCVPYSKSAVEKIASVSISELQDIGESEFLGNGPLDKEEGENSEGQDDLLKFNPNKKSTRLSLKSDDKIFLNAKDLKKTIYSNKLSENQNSSTSNSLFSKVNNWLFGWEDL